MPKCIEMVVIISSAWSRGVCDRSIDSFLVALGWQCTLGQIEPGDLNCPQLRCAISAINIRCLTYGVASLVLAHDQTILQFM